jgi:hypothetical protein
MSHDFDPHRNECPFCRSAGKYIYNSNDDNDDEDEDGKERETETTILRKSREL